VSDLFRGRIKICMSSSLVRNYYLLYLTAGINEPNISNRLITDLIRRDSRSKLSN
jgi:hypothetical protein